MTPEKYLLHLATLTQITAIHICSRQKEDSNIFFQENRQYIRRKEAKIVENSDHNIDPRKKIKKLYPTSQNLSLVSLWIMHS
jgi:hypothetical protein